ncbi:DDE Tnp4 domain-containing protein [Citrus sinensis]|nr:DDE Tnp4 domain-containing protein [Citrus sinensis]
MSSQGERANWTDPTYRKYFIDLCMREANNGNRSGATLKPTAWNRISQELKTLTGKSITPKQLKNGWDYMKRQYLTWLKLTMTTRHGYNSTTRTFDWPPERWEEYLKKYPEAKQFRNKPLANAEELEALFSGAVATGAYNWSSGMEGIPEMGNLSSMLSETPINVENNDCEDSIGAIDGTLIHACIPTDKQVPYRGRGRGECFQNVMALCDFDMIFRYVVVGWEGTAHDSRVLTETIRNSRNNFPIPPPDKYYLVDAAYSHTRGFMAPYRHVRYWLGDFRSGGRARGREEIFNHAHAKLRNVIERAFGVLKARFLILKRMAPYSFDTQRKIVVACMAIHNFLRKISVDDALFAQYENDEVELESGHGDQNHTANAINSSSMKDQNYMRQLRDEIANQLFQTSY